MLYPEFMEYRRRRKGAAAPIDGRGSGRRMDDPHRHSRGLIRVQAAAGTDHHRRRSELDRDLGGIMAVILGVEVSRTTDFIKQVEGAAEAVTTTEGTLPPIPTPTSRATTARPTTPHRYSSISSSSSSHTVHHLPLLLQPLHLLIPGRLPRPLLFTSLG